MPGLDGLTITKRPRLSFSVAVLMAFFLMAPSVDLLMACLCRVIAGPSDILESDAAEAEVARRPTFQWDNDGTMIGPAGLMLVLSAMECGRNFWPSLAR